MLHSSLVSSCSRHGLRLSSKFICRSHYSASRHLPLQKHSPRCRKYSIWSTSEAGAGSVAEAQAEAEAEAFGTYSVILPQEPFVFGVSHIAPRPVPPHIKLPPYVASLAPADRWPGDDARPFSADPYTSDGRIPLGGDDECRLRRAAVLAKQTLEFAGSLVKGGVTTNTIDAAVHEFVVARGAYPSPLLYAGFPKACCTSINNVIVHGIPDGRALEDGDIINIDITVYVDGYHGDTSRTFLVGDVDNAGRELVGTTSEALDVGLAVCGPGAPFKAIGNAIHDLATQRGYSVSNQFTGHGIGSVFHRPPWILHHRNDEPGTMLPGHCFTIEPCLIQGPNPRGWIFPDGWTASTENCARSAQKEHMVLITETSAEIITA